MQFANHSCLALSMSIGNHGEYKTGELANTSVNWGLQRIILFLPRHEKNITILNLKIVNFTIV